MPYDADGFRLYPSYDQLVVKLREGTPPEDDNLQLLATVTAHSMEKELGYNIYESQIMEMAVADATKEVATNGG
tara:strand:- start:629 stop:850 length:222 start_codon:yes stop_codon:yes gene_type:complete